MRNTTRPLLLFFFCRGFISMVVATLIAGPEAFIDSFCFCFRSSLLCAVCVFRTPWKWRWTASPPSTSCISRVGPSTTLWRRACRGRSSFSSQRVRSCVAFDRLRLIGCWFHSACSLVGSAFFVFFVMVARFFCFSGFGIGLVGFK